MQNIKEVVERAYNYDDGVAIGKQWYDRCEKEFREIEELKRLVKIAKATENKPIKVTKSPYNIAFCPKCKGSVWQNKDESKFCFRCGQMISW